MRLQAMREMVSDRIIQIKSSPRKAVFDHIRRILCEIVRWTWE
jgi:hypothetical protein